MAKPVTQKIKLLSTAGTGFFYVTKKNPRTATEKLAFKKYDTIARQHVDLKESKINWRSGPCPRLGPAGGGLPGVLAWLPDAGPRWAEEPRGLKTQALGEDVAGSVTGIGSGVEVRAA